MEIEIQPPKRSLPKRILRKLGELTGQEAPDRGGDGFLILRSAEAPIKHYERPPEQE